MNMPSAPGASRGQPAFDLVAQDTIAAVRGQQPQRYWVPADYEPAEMDAEAQAEAAQLAADEARICRYCIGEHYFPTSVGCPRIAEATLAADGSVTSVKFWPGKDWAKGRVVFFEDLHEKKKSDGG